MRVLLIALMITLLPLRGWVGGAMAMEMAAAAMVQPASAIESGAGGATGPWAAADSDAAALVHADCSGHAVPQADDSQAHPQCEACSACQICYSVALTAAPVNLAPSPQSGDRLPAAAPFFASAERAPGFKPPIS